MTEALGAGSDPFPVPGPRRVGKAGSRDQRTRARPGPDSAKEKRAQGTAGLQIPL